jgi:hypothetical protein
MGLSLQTRAVTIATLPSPFILRCGLDIIRVSVLNLSKRATTLKVASHRVDLVPLRRSIYLPLRIAHARKLKERREDFQLREAKKSTPSSPF